MAVTKPSDRQPADEGSGSAAGAETRADADRARSLRDHAAINRLADDLLPALIARLSSSGLGEIEVREGAWKARLRKPVGGRLPLPRPEHQTIAPARAVAHREDRRAADATPEEELGVVVAKSPAVGVYTPRRDLVMGMRVRSGDRIGVVDVLGVQQDVLSPIEGVIGSSLAEAGEAVEYGQELVRIEVGEAAAAQRPAPGQKASAAVGSAS
jgi:biotin carboxyl carrier protein